MPVFWGIVAVGTDAILPPPIPHLPKQNPQRDPENNQVNTRVLVGAPPTTLGLNHVKTTSILLGIFSTFVM